MPTQNFSFISCVNDNEMYNACLKFINNLNVPNGYSIEYIKIENAKSMTSGYNEGISKATGKYKIYLHQDVLIINKNFLLDILDVFKDERIGLIGVAGAQNMPPNGIWWESRMPYNHIYHNAYNGNLVKNEYGTSHKKIINAEAIDGLIMITQYDVKWRDDIFCGWHFYDVSQVQEYSKFGYKTVILNNKEADVIHDCGITWTSSDEEYEKYRKIFLKEYNI